jgi:hypothetical protein
MAISDVNNVMRKIMADVRYLAASDSIASASTTDIGSKDSTFLTITGTTTINGLGTVDAGIYKFLIFDGALTLTYNAASMILLGGASRVTAAGDTSLFVSLGAGNWREIFRNQTLYSFGTAATYNIGTEGANVPLLNTANIWDARQTVRGLDPTLTFQETDAAADGKNWDIIADGGTFSFRVVNDAYSTASTWLTVTRTAIGLNNINFPEGITTGSPTGGFLGSGTINSHGVYKNGVEIQPLSERFTETTLASTSGTSVLFTGISASARRVDIMLEEVSTNGTSDLNVQLGGASGIKVTSGYLGAISSHNTGSGTENHNTSFKIGNSLSAAVKLNGVVSLLKGTGNKWYLHSELGSSTTTLTMHSGGSVDLGETLTQLSVSADGDTFDSGSITILVEV